MRRWESWLAFHELPAFFGIRLTSVKFRWLWLEQCQIVSNPKNDDVDFTGKVGPKVPIVEHFEEFSAGKCQIQLRNCNVNKEIGEGTAFIGKVLQLLSVARFYQLKRKEIDSNDVPSYSPSDSTPRHSFGLKPCCLSHLWSEKCPWSRRVLQSFHDRFDWKSIRSSFSSCHHSGAGHGSTICCGYHNSMLVYKASFLKKIFKKKPTWFRSLSPLPSPHLWFQRRKMSSAPWYIPKPKDHQQKCLQKRIEI